MPVFRTPFCGYAVKFSPFYETRLAVATAQNFGIVGNGRQHILDLNPAAPGRPITEIAAYDTNDAVYDCAWCEDNENLLVSAVANGSVKIYDLSLPPQSNPIRSLHEHTKEVHSVDYNPVRRDSFVSASWDDTLRLWTLDRPQSLRAFVGHAYCVYSASWNPRHPDVLASASGDATLRVWDVREDSATIVIPGHEAEVLSCDWNKYNECLIATGSVDKSVRIWDVRSTRAPVSVMLGHGYAVRRVRCSPHKEGIVASCSYDMSVRVWDFRSVGDEGVEVERYDHHTEFAVGVDFSVLVEGMMASVGWDETVYVWQMGTDPRAP